VQQSSIFTEHHHTRFLFSCFFFPLHYSFSERTMCTCPIIIIIILEWIAHTTTFLSFSSSSLIDKLIRIEFINHFAYPDCSYNEQHFDNQVPDTIETNVENQEKKKKILSLDNQSIFWTCDWLMFPIEHKRRKIAKSNLI